MSVRLISRGTIIDITKDCSVMGKNTVIKGGLILVLNRDFYVHKTSLLNLSMSCNFKGEMVTINIAGC